MKTAQEKFKIMDDMIEFLKIALETDDVQIIADIDLDGEFDESLPKATRTRTNHSKN